MVRSQGSRSNQRGSQTRAGRKQVVMRMAYRLECEGGPHVSPSRAFCAFLGVQPATIPMDAATGRTFQPQGPRPALTWRDPWFLREMRAKGKSVHRPTGVSKIPSFWVPEVQCGRPPCEAG